MNNFQDELESIVVYYRMMGYRVEYIYGGINIITDRREFYIRKGFVTNKYLVYIEHGDAIIRETSIEELKKKILDLL